MNDEQVERLLSELSNTRESFDRANQAFDGAISSIRWNKINTRILYCLMVIVFVLGVIGLFNFFSYRTASCERGNDLRITVALGMEENAMAIGAALAVVFDAPPERLQQYIDAYRDQQATEDILKLREC